MDQPQDRAIPLEHITETLHPAMETLAHPCSSPLVQQWHERSRSGQPFLIGSKACTWPY